MLDPDRLSRKYAYQVLILEELTRYGVEAVKESAKRADELAADADLAGVALWLRVIDAIRQLAITTPIGSVH